MAYPVLSRRTLRAHALQQLYAWHTQQQARQQLTLTHLTSWLETYGGKGVDQAAAEKLLLKLLQAPDTKAALAATAAVPEKQAVAEALRYYQRLTKAEGVPKNRLEGFCQALLDNYFRCLAVLIQWQQVAQRKGEAMAFLVQNEVELLDARPFAQHALLQRLAQQPALKEQLTAGWEEQSAQAAGWYETLLKPMPAFVKYCGQEQHTVADEEKLLVTLIEKMLFKAPPIQQFFSEHELYWSTYKLPIKRLLRTTCQLLAKNAGKKIPFPTAKTLTNKAGAELYQTLLTKVPEKEELLLDMLAKKSASWDVHRMAWMDKLILLLALCEFLYLPDIPLNVTINEYLELADQYSTPKSKAFINGMLDALAKQLLEEGMINKSKTIDHEKK